MGHGHAEASLTGELRFTLDTEESVRSFDPAHRLRGSRQQGAMGRVLGQRYAQVKDLDDRPVRALA